MILEQRVVGVVVSGGKCGMLCFCVLFGAGAMHTVNFGGAERWVDAWRALDQRIRLQMLVGKEGTGE